VDELACFSETSRQRAFQHFELLRAQLVDGRGLGRPVAVALAREGVDLVINARTQDALKTTAEHIGAETGVKVIPIAAGITNEEGREVVLAGCPNQDILINNAGGPPPGDFPQVTREDRIRAIDANMLTPVFLIRAVVAGMVARGFGRIINITTMGVKSPRTYPQLGVSDRRPVRTDRRFRRVPLQRSDRLSDGSKY
jgi:3-oxoacyl-[acyl-carrier protein] reductase